MANKPMGMLNIGSDTYELVDIAGRQATSEVDDKVDGLSASNLPYSSTQSTKQAIDSKTQYTNTQTPFLSVGGTYQLTQEMLSCKILLFSPRRAGYAGSFFVFPEKISSGLYNYGICCFCTNTYYYTFTISNTGILTLAAKHPDLGDPNVDIVGLL